MKPLLNWGLLLFAWINFYNVTAQVSLTNTVTTVPLTVDVCGASASFTYTIDNVSSFTITNNEVLFDLPSGMNYISGSSVGCTELDISNLNQPVFSFPDFTPTDPIIVITFSASVGCDAIAFLQGGGSFQNVYYHTYDYGSGQSNTETTTSVTYNVDYPFLLISNVTNQSYSANTGDTYSQCATITNSGQAPLGDLWFVNAHGSDLSTANYAPGTVMATGSNYDSVYVDGTGFLGVGNGDLFLDPGESFTICYDVTVNGCDFVSSTFSTTWGCDGQFCQEGTSTSNVTFSNLIPELEFLVTQNTSDACLGNADTFSISIENSGSGTAYNVLVDIFNHWSGNQTNAYLGYIVAGSFSYTINGSPSVVPGVVTNAVNSEYSCVPANSPSDVTVTIPTINPGDVVVITFEHYLCCPDFCATTHSIPGLGFNAFYENICGFSYAEPFVQIYNYDRIYATIFNDNSPFNATGGQATLMNFGLNPSGNSFPSGAGASYVAQFTLPPCGVWDGQSFFTHYNGSNVNPDSTSVNGTTITSFYSLPLSINQGTFHVGFIPDCSTTAGCMVYIDSMPVPCLGIAQDMWVPDNPIDVTMELFYMPDTTCSCFVNMCSLTIPVILDCPPTGQFIPTDGITIQEFEFKRISYGLPDNNNDGQPDAGPLDLSLIRTDRAVYGDTLTATAVGVIDTVNGNSNYQYFIAKIDIVEGINISAIGGQIEVYDDNTGTFFTENIVLPTVTTSSVDRYFEFEVDASTFVNAPASFLFEQNDSVWVDIDFRVTLNPGNSIDILEVTNYFFVTNNPVAVDTTGGCKHQDLLSIYGYYFTIWAPNTLYPSECDSILFTESYYLSIGPCCSNYAGGNAFSYEFRNFATLDTMEIVLPAGYYYSSARIRELRTTGNGTSTWSAWQNITPSANIPPVWVTQAGGNHYKFPTSQLYTNGSFLYPDEGFSGTLEFYATPSCEVEQYVANDIGYIADFDTDTLWWDSPTSTTFLDSTRDVVTYEGAELFIQATLPFIQSQSNQATWTVTIQNVSSVVGSNIFLALDNISGNLNASSIYHVNSSTTIPNNGNDIFYVGDIPAGEIWEFEITADISGCGVDSIEVYAGWNCTGTPVDLASYPCLSTTPSIVLSVLPLTPVFISQLSVLNDTLPLCDLTTMRIEGENIQLGWAYDLDLTVTLPTGMTIVPGSSVACFPAGSGNCAPIADPVGIGNSQVLWDSLVFNSIIGSTGFPGFDSTNTIEVTFDIEVGCDFTSGTHVTASYQGYAGCGDQTGEEIGESPPIYIQGATVPFEAQIYLESSSLSPCEDSTLLEIWVTNDGPTNFGASDSVTVILPDGFYYVTGSTIDINAGPSNLNPSITAVGTDTYLTWPVPAVIPGDSTHFSIYYQGDPTLLECEALEISAYSTTVNTLPCITTGTNCPFNMIVNDTSTFVFIYKGFLELLNGSGIANLGPGNNETIQLTYDISNFGNTISPNYPTTINYYSDANNNGILDGLDPLILSETYNILLDSNTTFTMVDTLLFPSGSGCQLLVELQEDENDCSCLSDTLLIIPELELNYPDTFVCANIPIVLGDSIPTGYAQLWLTLDPAEAGALSSSSGAMPTALWNPSPINQTDTIDIEITTDRIGCFAIDTVQLLVHPAVAVDAGVDTTICHYDAINLAGSVLNYADSLYWTQLSGPTALVFSDASDTLSLVSGFAAGTYELVLTGTSDFCASHSDTMTITAFDVALSELSVDHVSCFGYADGEIQLEANNGVAPYFFSLDGGAYTSSTFYSPLDTGSYTFVVQDLLGCYDTLIGSITQPAALTVTLTGVDISCSTFLDGYITSNAAGGTMPYSYLWSNAAVTPDIFGLDSGQYILNITDTNGCIASDSVILSSPQPVIVNAGSDDSLCYYDGFNLSGAIVSLVDSIAWEQISGPSSLTFSDINDLNTAASGFVGGSYELVLYGYNVSCPGHSDTVIIASFEPQINELSVSNVSCFNFADGELNVAGSNGLIPYLYSVNGGAYTAMTSYPSLDTGTYEFVMQDNFGCLDTLVSTITQPDSIAIVFAQTDVSCFGFTDGAIDATISGGMPTYNFSWSNGQATQNATALGAGWQSLTVIDDNGCIAVDSIEILEPLPLNLTATIDSVNCNGNSDGNIDVHVTGGTVNYNYAWTGGIVTEDLIGYPAGIYDLVVTDDNGCVISASYEIIEPDSINYSVSINHESCENLCDGEIDLTSISGGTGSYSIILNGTNQFGNQLFSDLCSGNYTIEVKDENGCSLSSIEVIDPGLLYADASFSVAPILCAYDTIVTIVAVDPSGNWTANGIPSTLDINPANLGPGIYDIEHIIPGICPDTSNQTITINEVPVPNIWADQLTICNPDVVTLNNMGTSGVNCLWDISGWTSSNCGPITFGTSQDGYFDVTLTVTNANGCTASQAVMDYLYFSNAPIADFYADPDSIVSYYEPTINFVNTSLNAVSYEWFINGSALSTNVDASYTNPTGLPASYAVTLIAMNEYGCSGTHTTTINYQDEPVLYVPNAFTPDGSSLNNTFFPVGNGVQITEWLIFNRWGEILFQSHNIDSEWDGTYNGVLVQDGIYTWKITYLSENSGTPVTLFGHVNVLK